MPRLRHRVSHHGAQCAMVSRVPPTPVAEATSGDQTRKQKCDSIAVSEEAWACAHTALCYSVQWVCELSLIVSERNVSFAHMTSAAL
jgi:hypothetical protein